MKSIAITTFVLLSSLCLGQKTAPVKVKVSDEKGMPYPGDKILFVGQTKHDVHSGITNSKGEFLIQLPEGQVYDIRVKSIGKEMDYNELEIPALPPDQFTRKMYSPLRMKCQRNTSYRNCILKPEKPL